MALIRVGKSSLLGVWSSLLGCGLAGFGVWSSLLGCGLVLPQPRASSSLLGPLSEEVGGRTPLL